VGKHKGRQTGPRTPHGKKQSSKNSRIHGLLSREIVLSDAERSQFEELKNALKDELQPSTPLQEFLFDEILTGMWKCKLALRFELRELKRATEENQEDLSVAKGGAPAEPIYADTRHALGRKLQLVRELKQKVEPGGYVSDAWKEAIIAAFGERFYAMLQEWKPTNPVLLPVLDMIVKKSETFRGIELPGRKLSSDELKAVSKEQTAFEDPLRLQFVAKLLEMQQMHLEQLIEAGPSAATERKQTDPLERFLRYQTTVKRDLYRAIERYLEVKANLGE
jgi:hypothetical protein